VVEILTKGPEQTAALGTALAGWLREGDVVLLHGDLGAGKTVLAKGIAAALRVDGVVSSPSFALVNEYESGLFAPVSRLYHIDLYRLHGEDDLASIGFEEYIAPVDGVTVIEWPERAGSSLPDRYLLIEITAAGESRRRVRITYAPTDDAWVRRIANLQERVSSFLAKRDDDQGQ
jgi:tRNA threonylcarbamoyladenosine biosynthesis protein TsaE